MNMLDHFIERNLPSLKETAERHGLTLDQTIALQQLQALETLTGEIKLRNYR